MKANLLSLFTGAALLGMLVAIAFNGAILGFFSIVVSGLILATLATDYAAPPRRAVRAQVRVKSGRNERLPFAA